eukprot:15330451-Ditylum_brightwellii.AAC.1
MPRLPQTDKSQEHTRSTIQKETGQKKKNKDKGKGKQKEIRLAFLGWDNSRCQQYDNKEHNSQNEIVEYYKDQDRPLDSNTQAIQTSVADYFGLNPQN